MFDFDGHVIGESRKFAMQRFRKSYGVAYTVEKIRVTEGDVLRSSSNLFPNVFQHDFAIHNSEDAVIDGNDRAVAAKMLAATAGFRVARDAVFTGRENDVRILQKRRKSLAVGPNEFLPADGDRWLGLPQRHGLVALAVLLEAFCEMYKPFLKLASENGFHTLGAKMSFIHWRV
jgi:hypothetical protein